MKLSAVLLAGGESRRMGSDKATLVVDGEALWQRQLRTLRELEPHTIYVSARTRPEWLPAEAELVLDELPSRGPLSGISATLKRIETSHLLVLAVDMPFITSAQLKALRSFASEGCGAVSVFGVRAEPLAAVYPSETQADVSSCLERNLSLVVILVVEEPVAPNPMASYAFDIRHFCDWMFIR